MVQVETTEVNEFGEVENKDERVRLVKELGLEGQEELMSDTEKPEIMPYRAMKADEKFIYEVLCPSKAEAKKYNAGLIPLRVLQVLSHAQSLNVFEKIEIWYADSVVVNDHVLVGIIKTDAYTDKYHILARWGEELESIDVLRKKAVANAKEVMKDHWSKVVSYAKSKLEAVDDLTEISVCKIADLEPSILSWNLK